MQIRKYTGTNDKYRKYQYTKIKGIKTIQKSSTFSSHNNNSSVVSPFSMKQNKLHSITHNPHSCTYENNKSNTTIIQHKKLNRAKNIQQNKNTNKIKNKVEQYNTQCTINDEILFKPQNQKRSTTINSYSYL